jgi:cell division protein FtsA
MKFKTAMDVRIGLPNEHLTGSGKNEINQPMYATSVGLIMRGFDFLETYKKNFNAGKKEEFVRSKKTFPEVGDTEEVRYQTENQPEEEKISLTDKIKSILTRMFEVEDQAIN